MSAARRDGRHGAIEDFPPALLGNRRDQALLFKNLATLKTDATLFRNIGALRWKGPTSAFGEWTERIETPRLLERALKAQKAL